MVPVTVSLLSTTVRRPGAEALMSGEAWSWAWFERKLGRFRPAVNSCTCNWSFKVMSLVMQNIIFSKENRGLLVQINYQSGCRGYLIDQRGWHCPRQNHQGQGVEVRLVSADHQILQSCRCQYSQKRLICWLLNANIQVRLDYTFVGVKSNTWDFSRHYMDTARCVCSEPKLHVYMIIYLIFAVAQWKMGIIRELNW